MDAEDVVVKEEIELLEEKPDLQEIKQEQQEEDSKDFNITVEDFPYICRVCCQRKSDLRPFEDEQYLLDLFHAIRKTDVHSITNFPKNICKECVCKLEDISSFIDFLKFNVTKMIENLNTTNEVETVENETSLDQVKLIGKRSEECEDYVSRHIYQNCRICSSTRRLTPLEGKLQLLTLFQSISNIDVGGDINSASVYLICEACNNKLEEISLFIDMSLCHDDRVSKFESVRADYGSNQIDVDSSTYGVSNSESATTATKMKNEDELEFRFVHEIKGRQETVYIKEESTDAEIYHTGGKPYSCDCCDKSFSKKSTLQNHLLTHTGEKPFMCDCCDKRFARKCTLNVHLLTHLAEKPFKCNHCEKNFTDKGSLKKHLLTHTGEKPFKCDCCDKSFIQKGELKCHLLTHTGEKPFKCDCCDRNFARKCVLQKHLLIHAGEIPFKCDSCDKSFTYKYLLRRHMVTHTGEKLFKCNHCDKSFTQKVTLQKHSFIHTGESPFKCDRCGKSFTDKYGLQGHLLFHTGEKPFKCDCCDKSFKQKRSLQKHSFSHTI